MIRIREAAVAGSFYPAEADALSATVGRLLENAPVAERSMAEHPVALVVPHAGYRYSGPVAASAYARLLPFRHDIDCVLLLGPCHYVPLHGLAASNASVFRTPLGELAIDHELLASLFGGKVPCSDVAHAPEHSLEVQLPFLQYALDSFRVVPLLAGDVRPGAVADLIERFWRRPGRLVVVSTDLSHYQDYEEACRMDRATCRAIESLAGDRIGSTQACGAGPLKGLLEAAARAGLRSVTLDLRNSGDTANRRDRVVGYGAWMFVEEASCRHAA